jgi:hypothetical protein
LLHAAEIANTLPLPWSTGSLSVFVICSKQLWLSASGGIWPAMEPVSMDASEDDIYCAYKGCMVMLPLRAANLHLQLNVTELAFVS